MTDPTVRRRTPFEPPEQDPWEGILAPEEKIIWQGRPDPSFEFSLMRLPIVIFGLFFSGFAVFWMLIAASAGGFI